VFLILWLFVFLYAMRLRIITHPAFIFNVFVALCIGALAFVDIGLVTDPNMYIFSDEKWFSPEAKRPLEEIISSHKRYLAYILFSHSTYLFAGEWAFKIQSIPFALFSSLILYDATRKKSTLWLFPIVFSFIFFLATLNLRDVILFSAMLFFMLKVSRSKLPGIITWSTLTILFFSVIRPEYSIVCFFIMCWVLVNNRVKNKFLVLIIPAVTVIVLFVFFENAIFGIANYFYPGRVSHYVSDKAVELGQIPFLNDNATALVRQLITPLPLSKIIFIYNNEVPGRRILYEILRMIMMISYYFMFVVVLIKWKKAYYFLVQNRFIQILFMMAVINTVLYAIYRDGGGGSRNKLYPFILVYVFFINFYIFRIKKYVSDRSHTVLMQRGNIA
jgi:hypothetical protein